MCMTTADTNAYPTISAQSFAMLTIGAASQESSQLPCIPMDEYQAGTYVGIIDFDASCEYVSDFPMPSNQSPTEPIGRTKAHIGPVAS